MSEDDGFWDFYWENHLQAMDTLGKREAILTASRLVRRIYRQNGRPVRILEPGCGEGQVVGTVIEGHAELCDRQVVVGVDTNAQSLARCRRDYPDLRFIHADLTDPAVLSGLGDYDLILLVNVLHEVFSAGYSAELGAVDVPVAKHGVETALGEMVRRLAPGGWLVLFDGLEAPGDPEETLSIRFLDEQARDNFETFARQYRPFRIAYRETGHAGSIELTRHDFTRYITKSIFLGKALWQSERSESYQYFNEAEFRAALARQGLELRELRKLTVNEEKWRRWVEILTPGVDFPDEHILIVAQRLMDEG